jgi:O-Antigen ligase
MTRRTKRMRGFDQGITRSDRIMAAAMSATIFVTLAIWIALKEEAVKYILYTLPFTLTAIYLTIEQGRIKLHRPGVVALALYLVCAAASMVVSSSYGFFAIRDVAIIAGYLFLFVLWFRAPAAAADLALYALTAGMLVEAFTEGLGEDINLFGSQGILESTLAFPLGVVLLYYVHFRQWGRALLAAIVLFLAFKRITFVGVVLAVGFDLVISGWWRRRAARLAALAAVFALSVLALFSAQLFESMTAALNVQNTSANSISLGRYELAVQLWDALTARPLSMWLFGSGPGAADAFVSSISAINNPHNDWLKILFDYGGIGFLAFHAILYRIFFEHRLGLMLYIYSAVVMMTDNILIYMFYHPFVLLMLSAARREPQRMTRDVRA